MGAGAGQEWRCLTGNERIRMLHFPANYFDNVNLTEDERASLAGDPFSVKAFSRLMHACGLGVWSPAKTRMKNDRVVTSNGEPEVKVQPHDDAPIGEERGKIKLEGRQAVSEKIAARLRATLLNAVNEKQDTHTGPYGLVKIKSTDSNDTNWMVRGYRTLRKMLPAIRELPFLNKEAFDGILVTVVTEDDQTQVIKLPEGTELLYIWTLSGRASLQWGEGQLRVQGSISKLSVKAEETDMITVRLFSRDAIPGLAYRVSERKPKAIVKEANRAGPTPYQPGEAPMKKYGDPVPKTDALDIECHRIRTRQEEDQEIHPYIVLFEQGMGELRKKYGQKTAELTNRHKDDYEMVDGILARWVNLPGDGGRLVTVVPEGGARSTSINGQRRVLTWRAWMLHHAHNTAAGGHVVADGVESKILSMGWWSNLHKDREAWVSRCITCRAVKGHTFGSST